MLRGQTAGALVRGWRLVPRSEDASVVSSELDGILNVHCESGIPAIARAVG
jgi:hypothetical protein